MAQKKNTTKITVLKPCFDCGADADCFGWEPCEMVFCKKCSPYQKNKVKFQLLEDLRKEGLEVAIWGK